MKEDQKLISVGHFESEFDAQQAKECLQEAGIHAVVFGTSLAGASGLAVTGRNDYIDLRVFEEDEQRALEILEDNFEESQEGLDEDGVDEFDEFDEDEDGEGPGEIDE